MDCHDDDAKPTSSVHGRKSRNGAKGGSGTYSREASYHKAWSCIVSDGCCKAFPSILEHVRGTFLLQMLPGEEGGKQLGRRAAKTTWNATTPRTPRDTRTCCFRDRSNPLRHPFFQLTAYCRQHSPLCRHNNNMYSLWICKVDRYSLSFSSRSRNAPACGLRSVAHLIPHVPRHCFPLENSVTIARASQDCQSNQWDLYQWNAAFGKLEQHRFV